MIAFRTARLESWKYGDAPPLRVLNKSSRSVRRPMVSYGYKLNALRFTHVEQRSIVRIFSGKLGRRCI